MSNVEQRSTEMWGRFMRGQFDKAAEIARGIVREQPRHGRARAIQAIMAWRAGNEAMGLRLVERAIDGDPNDVEIRRIAARQQAEAGHLELALQHICAARDLQDNWQTQFDVALYKIHAGHWPEGWVEYDARIPRELRVARFGDVVAGTKPIPQWNGDPFNGTLFIEREMGYGDFLQFARFLPWAASRCTRLVVRIPPRLERLFNANFPGIQFITESDNSRLPKFKQWAYLMSLPARMGLTQAMLSGEPYLQPWVKLNYTTPMKVGVVWSGSPKHPRDQLRSLPAESVVRLLKGAPAGVEWHAIAPQLGEDIAAMRKVQHLACPQLYDIKDRSDECLDFADTAKVVAEMALVISVDTSIVHLAGAMGCPTWVLLSTAPEFRWPYGRTDSPWYDSVEVFKQPQPGDWNGAIADVHHALAKLVGKEHRNADRAHRDREHQ